MSSAPQRESDLNQLPHNEEVEQALLGALIVAPEAFEDAGDFLRANHFYSAVHGRIFEAIALHVERGKDPSPKILASYFEQDDDLQHVGGGKYIRDLASQTVSTRNVAEYAAIIHDLHVRRGLIFLGDEVTERARRANVDDEVAAQLESAERKLYEFSQLGARAGNQVSIADATGSTIEFVGDAFKHGRRPGLQTGWRELDRLTGGLHPGNLIVLAGSTSMGKSAFATNLSLAVSRRHADSRGKDGAPVAYFTLEMSAEEVSARVLASVSGISSEQITQGEIGEREYLELLEAQQKITKDIPLTIDQTPALSVPQLRVRARRLQRTHQIGLVVVDYLQLMDPSGRAETRVQEITEITRGLKAVAKELNVPVVALSQLNRSVSTRDNKRPQLPDLRESGSIEQDADVVMLIHRDHYYVEKQKPMQGPEEKSADFAKRMEHWEERERASVGKAEILVAKQRQGRTGCVELTFDPNVPRFVDPSRTAQKNAA